MVDKALKTLEQRTMVNWLKSVVSMFHLMPEAWNLRAYEI
jgi:hypothetical protein